MKIALSELDRIRFGITVAKAALDAKDDVDAIMKWCGDNKVKMLIARCACEDIQITQKLEAFNSYLMDTLVYFQNKRIVAAENLLDGRYSWRIATESDADMVEELAGEVFEGYSGHYHADSRLNKKDSDLVYSSWAKNSCYGGSFSDVVFLILYDEKIVGFLTVKKQDPTSCEIILNGVSPRHQNNGLYSFLVSLTKNWALNQKIKTVTISTQITNIAVQKVWCRQGFEPLKSYYTFHKWFN
ncbi:GNAT family N-acetyltransferase [Paraherbaspirillum soli]|uniref:GNAT family N-acetyltransferase n=1 Tax=Paraherbaspirillum soli TaxID=631222 RepID=A0ABW0MDA5_9BURK